MVHTIKYLKIITIIIREGAGRGGVAAGVIVTVAVVAIVDVTDGGH